MGKARSRADGDYKTDNAVVDFGADGDVTLTHDPDDGLILKSKATADDNPVLLTLQTGETDLAANDVIGKISFQAPDEGTGTDAILVSAAIQARAEGDHSSSSNATSIDFMVGASEVAATKMTLTSAGKLEVAGGVDIEGGAVFNEDSADVDFRVESNGNANMINVDGGNDRVGIGISPLWTTQIDKSSTNTTLTDLTDAQLVLSNTGTATANQHVKLGFRFQDGSLNGQAMIAAVRESGSARTSSLRFYSAPSSDGDPDERLKIEGAGDVVVSTGDLIFGTSGKGINLGVTSNTDSNALDDYEEGTFTPTLYYQNTSGLTLSYDSQSGTYTKIGRMVHVYISLQADISGSLVNDNLGFRGLPFSVGVSGGSVGGIVNISNASGGGADKNFTLQPDGTTLYFSNSQGNGNMADDVGTGTNVLFQVSCWYIAS